MQPHVDFGLKLLGVDIMAIPGLYRFIQVTNLKNSSGQMVEIKWFWEKTMMALVDVLSWFWSYVAECHTSRTSQL